MKDNYKIERTCSKCERKQSLTVTKREAAFELVDYENIFGKVCSECGNDKFTTTFQKPNLDFELLKEWSLNPELYLMEKDEELLLADELYLDMILKILDTIKIPDHKRNLLMDALCVIVYDNTNEKNQKKDETLKNRVIAELNERKEQLKLADDWIMDYIKQVVYPQLDGK
ncbi:hypothetical protein [uncultured Aquimarina sp.]|uniref:hypothetical protein n=1 Tax=uncultured Aquimarina sp. TaxID=575652 RepID=UPI00260C9F50|nr:hypothetical protein [uncultured Aquimarina sp.]